MNVNSDLSKQCSDQNLQHWLEELFQDEDIPLFEETAEVMELLKQIVSANTEAEKNVNAIMKAEKNMKDGYDKKTKDLQFLTDFIQLSADTYQRVESLASLAEKMKLKEPSLTNFLLGMVESENREMLRKEKYLISNHHIIALSRKIDETMKTNEKLRRDLKYLGRVIQAQESLHSKRLDDIAHGVRKNKEFEEKINEREKTLKEVAFDPCLSHTTLVKEAENLKIKEKEVKLRKSKLEAYQGLPLTYDNAVLMVQVKDKELLELQEEIQKLLDI
ncbi:uncharacterized protein NPIL_606861 [Nephila pilipes]|uniref:HAUS augmin-like complex subunit 1 n=1 Tax=Nephila pilipes TaxID=299642 RepID=A0A8X6QGR0_NEPPI|nr:uncharacterized protein NPIL_606861 [Nephila pilipes]